MKETCRFCSIERSSNRWEPIRGKRRAIKTISKTIKIGLEVNGLDKDTIYDRALWYRLIHVADPI